MAEEREEKIRLLKQKLTLTGISLTNATNALKSGKTVSGAMIDDLITAHEALKKQITRLESGEEEINNSPQPPLKAKEAGVTDEIGLPERLRVKRYYTMTPDALKQRKKARSSPKRIPALREGLKGNRNAWKHGKYAQTVLRRIFRPCLSTCSQYPCSLVSNGETEPGENCIDKTELALNIQALTKALSGDLTDMKDIISVRLASTLDIIGQLQEDIARDGTMIKSEKWGKDGQLLGHEIKPHPSFLALQELSRITNISLSDFMLTPKSLVKQEEDEAGLKTIADLMSNVGKAIKKQQENNAGS